MIWEMPVKQYLIPIRLIDSVNYRWFEAHHERRKCSALAVRPEPVEGSEYDVFQTESVLVVFKQDGNRTEEYDDFG